MFHFCVEGHISLSSKIAGQHALTGVIQDVIRPHTL